MGSGHLSSIVFYPHRLHLGGLWKPGAAESIIIFLFLVLPPSSTTRNFTIPDLGCCNPGVITTILETPSGFPSIAKHADGRKDQPNRCSRVLHGLKFRAFDLCES